jgi:hypothetical protein
MASPDKEANYPEESTGTSKEENGVKCVFLVTQTLFFLICRLTEKA